MSVTTLIGILLRSPDSPGRQFVGLLPWVSPYLKVFIKLDVAENITTTSHKLPQILVVHLTSNLMWHLNSHIMFNDSGVVTSHVISSVVRHFLSFLIVTQ